MDNEKNNDQNPNRKRHRFQKPKGYFIEPNTENAEKKDQSIKIENVASEGQDKAQKQKKAENQPEKRNPSQNQNQNRNSGENVQQKKNHHKHHRRSDSNYVMNYIPSPP